MSRASFALVLLGIAGCAEPPPPDMRTGLELADRAWLAKDHADAERRYLWLYKEAHAKPHPAFAVIGLEMAAVAARDSGATTRAIGLYAELDDQYPQAFGGHAERHRLPNNYAVLLAEAGRPDDAIAALERPLKAFDGQSNLKRYPVLSRLALTRNLITLHLRHDWDERSAALWDQTLGWLEPHAATSPGTRGDAGMQELVELLGKLARQGPDAEEAGRLARLDALWPEKGKPGAAEAGRKLCDHRPSDAGPVRLCYEML
jgi:hypothetical protein